jgi:PAS domain S-box-containing protein
MRGAVNMHAFFCASSLTHPLAASIHKVRQVPINASFVFPVEWTNAVLILALMSICMVLMLFVYLNHRFRRPYFSLWIVSWLCYAGYLAAAIGLEESPEFPFLVMMRRLFIGMSAVYMFWGSFNLAGRPRSLRELQFAAGMLVVWSAVAAFIVQDRFWITMPVFALLASAGIYTGVVYLLQRKTYHGGLILGIGFLLWGAHLLAFPFTEGSRLLTSVGYFTTAVLTTMIVTGMVVEREVTIAEQGYRTLFDSASDAIFLISLAPYNILEANASALRLTKRAILDLAGRPFFDICPALKSAETTAANLEGMKLFNSVFRPYNEFPMIRSDGTSINCEGEVNLVQWHQRLALQVNVKDVSERKKVGEQLRRAEKMSALGKLIAGVAHELNNPLAVIAGYSEVMAEKKDLDAESREQAQMMHHESQRASRIVRDLLSFSRPSEPQKKPMDMNRLVSSVLETQEAKLRAGGIELEQRLANTLPSTMADPQQIEQILVNLIGNAIQAMEGRPNPRCLSIETEAMGNYVQVVVADTGPGIPNEIKSQIFDPFFTTKPLGKGTGLGLTICNTIIQEHRGRILVENKAGGGAKFVVELPIVECAMPVVMPVVMPERPVPETRVAPKEPAKKSVLLVDDEPGVLGFLKLVLTREGYDVTTATNGQEAVRQVKDRSYDLIISDMRMPELDGRQFFEIVNKQDSVLARRIIFATGDTVSPETQAFFTSTGNRWLSKPFTKAQVLEVVRGLLAEELDESCRGGVLQDSLH